MPWLILGPENGHADVLRLVSDSDVRREMMDPGEIRRENVDSSRVLLLPPRQRLHPVSPQLNARSNECPIRVFVALPAEAADRFLPVLMLFSAE